MASNILNIGKSAILTAQVGISTAGHNIANANTPGYTRQIVVQGAAEAQNFGFGFLGQGAQIKTIDRAYNELLTRQVLSSQTTHSELSTYATQMRQIDNLLANPQAGLSPSLQSFFSSVQAASVNPNDAPTRQAMLSNAQALASRFQALGNRLSEVSESVNEQLSNATSLVNSYAKQIAGLNTVIENAVSADGQPPNDLMDQRDQLVNELSKQIKVSVVKQQGEKYNIFIGNGLPLVVGETTYNLSMQRSPTDSTRLEVAYTNTGGTSVLGSNSLSGGNIGGLLQFREQSMDTIQGKMGLVAVGLIETFNRQHIQATDRNGNAGGLFFSAHTPNVTASTENNGNANINVAISNVGALTGSNYRLQFDGSIYLVTRTDTGASQSFSSLPQTLDGLEITMPSGSMSTGDDFLIKPTSLATNVFKVAITDPNRIALGGPLVGVSAASTNTGTATVGAVAVSNTYASAPLASPINLTYNSGTGNLNGFPATQAVSVTTSAGTTLYAAGSPVPYVNNATYSVSGISFAVSGIPNNGDQLSIAANTNNGIGDNRNALLLAGLQTASTLLDSRENFDGAYGQLISFVGNKTNELNVTSAAEAQMLEFAVAAQQSESGVNLDEEAADLLRYQQAYQAAGKMMQVASQLFELLLAIGN